MYYPEPDGHSKNKKNAEIDLYNHATQSEFQNQSGFNTKMR